MAVLPITCRRAQPEPLTDVSALNEVYVIFIVTARSSQDTQEVQVVTQVLNERRPHAAETTGGIIVNITRTIIPL